jgi:hypothetical protein
MLLLYTALYEGDKFFKENLWHSFFHEHFGKIIAKEPLVSVG